MFASLAIFCGFFTIFFSKLTKTTKMSSKKWKIRKKIAKERPLVSGLMDIYYLFNFFFQAFHSWSPYISTRDDNEYEMNAFQDDGTNVTMSNDAYKAVFDRRRTATTALWDCVYNVRHSIDYLISKSDVIFNYLWIFFNDTTCQIIPSEFMVQLASTSEGLLIALSKLILIIEM